MIELDNKDIWVLLELGLEHTNISGAIAELEEAMKPKSCVKCKAFKLDDEHNDGFGQCFWGIHFPNGNSSSYHKGTDFYCSEFEAKGQ